MRKVSYQELETVYGGDTISGTVINAFTNIIKVLMEAGRGVGSAIRRIAAGSLCPLD